MAARGHRPLAVASAGGDTRAHPFLLSRSRSSSGKPFAPIGPGLAAVAERPQDLGIGLGEDTSMVVRGGRFRVTGVNGKTTVTRLIAHILGRTGRVVE